MLDEFNGKTYLVPGASSGIGLCVCKKLANLGANVIMLARNAGKLASAFKSLSAGNHFMRAFDVESICEIEALVLDLQKKYARIDGMVYCVGNGDICRLRDLSYERLHRVMLSNFYAFMQFTRSLATKKSKKERLAIVALSSLASTSPEKYFTAYSASKAAMEAAIHCLALELCNKNITINGIKPGVVKTERLTGLNDITGDIEKKIRDSGFQPMGLIPPGDVADLAIYLLSDSAAYINGSIPAINGGGPC